LELGKIIVWFIYYGFFFNFFEICKRIWIKK